MSYISWCRVILAAVALLAIAGVAGLADVSAQPGGWSQAERVPDYAAEAPAPLLLADQNRTVHAFTSQLVEDTVAIVYRQWTLDYGWTKPVDILLSPDGESATVIGAYLDPVGTMHVAFFGSKGRDLGVYYSTAPAAIAGRAPSWSSPRLVGSAADPLLYGALAGDEKGNLFVVYGGTGAGNGVYSVHSSDNGETWSKPTVVYLTYSRQRWASEIRAVVDSEGRLHTVWTIVGESGNGDGIYYARMEGDHLTWSQPVVLAAKTEYEADTASIIEHKQELFLLYLNGQPPVRWMRRSRDGGRSWSEPANVFEDLRGGNGPAFLLNDSKGALRAFFGNRTGPHPNTIHGLWHSVWVGDRWGPVEPVVSGPQVQPDAGEPFDPWSPQAVISQGKVLLVTWVQDPAMKNGVWHSHLTLDVPESPLVPLPKAPSMATALPKVDGQSVAPTPISTRSPLPGPKPQSVKPRMGLVEDNGLELWLISSLPVLLLVLAAAGTRAALSKRT